MRDTLAFGVAESAPAASAQGYPRGPGAEMKGKLQLKIELE